jgi:alcohol dehydrogenase
MIEEGLIDTSPWITHRLCLDDVPARFEEVTKREGLKTMVEVNVNSTKTEVEK